MKKKEELKLFSANKSYIHITYNNIDFIFTK